MSGRRSRDAPTFSDTVATKRDRCTFTPSIYIIDGHREDEAVPKGRARLQHAEIQGIS